MKTPAIWVGLFLALQVGTAVSGQVQTGPWPPAKAWEWYARQPWLVGCNFLPSTAVNDVEMWQAESFDAATIGRELTWARDLGFNTVRVFLNYVVWEADAPGLKARMDRFLDIADRRGIRTMFILFDDCFKPEPQTGKQPAPVPGVHNSQWVQSPGVKRRGDKAQWGELERYVKDVVGAFGKDRRVLMWDLYNEPTASAELVASTFKWAREAGPEQPLTSCWLGVDHSDILSFHCYGDLNAVRAEIEKLFPNRRGRPYVCTEWMARNAGSRFETHLPFFKEQRIGCWNWGLVAGQIQTQFPWGSPEGAPEPAVWFHDILRSDGSPHSVAEAIVMKRTTGVIPAARRRALAPTAEKKPVKWRFSLAVPGTNWHQPGFGDETWAEGSAPFGRPEPAIGRAPRTEWGGGELWLRRWFEIPEGGREYALRMQHDEDAEVYVNGVIAAKLPGYNSRYEEFSISPEAARALTPGRNLLAVHCRQTTGGQYIDVGVVAAAETLPVRKLFDQPLRDTSICRGPEGIWYLTGTVEPFWAYNEGICLFKSRDLVNWEPLGMVWKYGDSPWHKKYLEAKKPLWAPEVHYLKSTFWLTYSIPGWDGTGKTSGSGLLKSISGKPEGPYQDMHPHERLGDEIDASLFEDEDGTVYFLWHSGKIARLKEDLSGFSEPYRWLKTVKCDANPRHHSGLCAGIFGRDSFDHVGYEGMTMFRANGRYYLSCAENFEGRYSCTVATSTNLFGPYVERYEALPHAGHNTFFRDELGRWWSTYFGSDPGAPWQERAGIFPVAFDAAGRLKPGD